MFEGFSPNSCTIESTASACYFTEDFSFLPSFFSFLLLVFLFIIHGNRRFLIDEKERKKRGCVRVSTTGGKFECNKMFPWKIRSWRSFPATESKTRLRLVLEYAMFYSWDSTRDDWEYSLKIGFLLIESHTRNRKPYPKQEGLYPRFTRNTARILY